MTPKAIALLISFAITVLLYFILKICKQKYSEKLTVFLQNLYDVGIILTAILTILQLSTPLTEIIGPLSTEPPASEPPISTSIPVETKTSAYTSLTKCVFLDDSNEEGSNSDVCVGDWTDVFGDYYPNSLTFWVKNNGKYSPTEHITYELDGQYKTISGKIVAEQRCESGANFVFTIYLDGIAKYETDQITESSKPLEFSYDISGVSEITIVCTTDSSSSGYCIFFATLS